MPPAVIASICLLLLPPPASARVAPDPADIREPSPVPSEIDRLVADLSSPRWSVRSAATEALVQQGEAAYDALRAEFRRTRSYDVKRRIRSIVEQIFLYAEASTRGGFLGISNERVDHSTLERIPPGEYWVLVRSVVADTAAERAGLRTGDYVTSLNGEHLTVNGVDFVTWIGQQTPGTKVKLGIRRTELQDQQIVDREFQIEVELGRRPVSRMVGDPRGRAMLDARQRFPLWFQREFDPGRTVDESHAIVNDPAWTLQPTGAGK